MCILDTQSIHRGDEKEIRNILLDGESDCIFLIHDFHRFQTGSVDECLMADVEVVRVIGAWRSKTYLNASFGLFYDFELYYRIWKR